MSRREAPVSLRLSLDKDEDIDRWLKNQPNKQAAIKAAIRERIARECESLSDSEPLMRKDNEALALLGDWLNGMKTYLDDHFAALPTAAQIEHLVRLAQGRVSEPAQETIKPELKLAIKKSMKQGLKLED